MSRVVRRLVMFSALALFVFTLLVSAASAAFLLWGLPELIGTITINGQEIAMEGHADAGHWLLATLGILVCLLALLTLVPLVIVLFMLAITIAFALAISPLLLVAAFALWVWRRSAARPGGANMPPTASPP
jgi:hypothetical protein